MLQRPVRLAFGLVVALILAGTLVFAAVRSDGDRGGQRDRERERGGQAEIISAVAAARGG
jgi:hypothetical protein